jgi:hypothetical protein
MRRKEMEMPKKRPVSYGTQSELNKEISLVGFHASVVAKTLASYLNQSDPVRQKWNLLTHEIEKQRQEILKDFAEQLRADEARWPRRS